MFAKLNHMPIKRPQFVNKEIYHIVIRGIAGQKTFLETKDYLRYLVSLEKFNSKNPVLDLYRDMNVVLKILSDFSLNTAGDVIPSIISDIALEKLLNDLNEPMKRKKPTDPLIDILTICLMPDHIHLLVRQNVENGISLFFQKMGGYSSYFNKKYKRFGSLFQRPFKAIHIKTQDQLLIVITYIHLNPISLIEPNWKIEGISDPEKVMQFLESYPWSSYAHYLGKKDLSWVVNDEFLKQILISPEEFQNFVKSRVFQKAELRSLLNKFSNIFLE